MFIDNRHADYRKPLDPRDAETLGMEAADRAERYLSHRDNHQATPFLALPAMACELSVKSIHIKDEGLRLGLGSFKALGGSYAVIRLALEGAARHLGRSVDIDELHSPEVRDVASRMTFGCATDGNHGRSVAQGAQLVGAKSAIFVHSGVSDRRSAAIASFGAEIIRVDGAYDDAVAAASRVCAQKGWTVVSDTSWPGYERIPGLVMQGYTAMMREALRALPAPPTHVFMQAGVGGLAAAVAGHLAIIFGDQRPIFVVVEPSRAACLFQSARAGYPHKIAHDEPTVMAMLECYEPSLVAWRILSRVADGFLTVAEEDAIAVMNRLARPAGKDPAIIAGESGGVGLAGLIRAAADPHLRALLGLGAEARVFLINTEGATDPERYRELVSSDRPTSPPSANA
jgi:diaminopropionate ammonia-lyase